MMTTIILTSTVLIALAPLVALILSGWRGIFIRKGRSSLETRILTLEAQMAVVTTLLAVAKEDTDG